MIEPLLCRRCHNTQFFTVTGTAVMDVDCHTGSTVFRRPQSFTLSPSSKATCVMCEEDDHTNSALAERMMAPVITVVSSSGSRAAASDQNIFTTFDGYRCAQKPLEDRELHYVTGIRGAAEVPTGENVSESIINWIMTVIRETGLPLFENRDFTQSDFYLKLHNLEANEWAEVRARCKAEGIG